MEILTAGQNSFVESIMFEHEPNFVWLGASDSGTEGAWLWTTSGTPVAQGFTYWAPGNPDDFPQFGGQDCLQFSYGGKRWDDSECHVPHPYVCQRPVSNGIVG